MDNENNTEQPREAVESLTAADVNDILSEYNIGSTPAAQAPVTTEPAAEYARNEEPHPVQQAPEGITIPKNSPTLLKDESSSRFSGAVWYDEITKANVIIAGLGGIGSHLAFNVARCKPAKIVLYDDDSVDISNLSGQLYSVLDMGYKKVTSLFKKLDAYSPGTEYYANTEKFTDETPAGDIMMCGFDNMAARTVFFNSWENHVYKLPEEKRKKCLFLDGRLSLSVMQVFCIRGDDSYNMKRYRHEFLFTDSEADHTVCSMKQTTYLASMIGAYMTNLFTNHIANLLDPVIPFSMPFFSEYDSQYMTIKMED